MSNWSDDVINALDSTSESKLIGETVGEVYPVQLLQTNFNLQGRPKTVKRLPAGISTSGETLSTHICLWNSLLIDSRLLGCGAQSGILYGEPGQGCRKCT